MGNHSLLRGIFLTQESNLGLPCSRQILYHPSHQGSPVYAWTHLNPKVIPGFVHNCYPCSTDLEMKPQRGSGFLPRPEIWIWATWLRISLRQPGMLQSMGSQRVRHNWATEQCSNLTQEAVTLAPRSITWTGINMVTPILNRGDVCTQVIGLVHCGAEAWTQEGWRLTRLLVTTVCTTFIINICMNTYRDEYLMQYILDSLFLCVFHLGPLKSTQYGFPWWLSW